MSYYNDSRVRWYKSINESSMKAVVTVASMEGNDYIETDVQVPFKFECCPTCSGRGTHVNPSIDCDGFSSDDFAADPDFARDYHSGNYDVACYGCDGKRVVPVCQDQKVNEYLAEEAREMEEMEAICAAERSMGA